MMKVLVSQKSYGGSEVLEIETRIRLIQQHSTSFVFEGHDSDPQIYTQYHSGLNYPSVRLIIFMQLHCVFVLLQYRHLLFQSLALQKGFARIMAIT